MTSSAKLLLITLLVLLILMLYLTSNIATSPYDFFFILSNLLLSPFLTFRYGTTSLISLPLLIFYIAFGYFSSKSRSNEKVFKISVLYSILFGFLLGFIFIIGSWVQYHNSTNSTNLGFAGIGAALGLGASFIIFPTIPLFLGLISLVGTSIGITIRKFM
jgi:hypothetical protein